MTLYFADRYMKVLGMASTSLPEGLIIVDDTKKEDIESGVASFSCTLSFYGYDRAELESYCTAGNYILRANDDDQEFYTIIESEIDVDAHSVEIYAEDAGLDLLNNVAGKFENKDETTGEVLSHNIAYYVEKYIENTGFVIGINEVSDMTKALSFDSEETVTSRLRSIASGFTYTDTVTEEEAGCEIGYSFTIDGLTITNKYVNIYKKRGVDSGVQLRLGKEVSNITITRSVANLATALLPTGGQDESNETVTLVGFTGWTGTTDDFYVDSTTGQLRSRTAMAKWTRFNSDSGGDSNESYIVKTYSGTSTTQEDLANEALKELKKICDTEVNWDVEIIDLPKEIKMGDLVYVIDDAGKNYIQARLLAIETSITSHSTTITLGDYIIKNDGINEEVAQLASEFSSMAKNRKIYTWTAYADDSDGTNASLSSYKKAYIGTLENMLNPLVDISQVTEHLSEFTWEIYDLNAKADASTAEEIDRKITTLEQTVSGTLTMTVSAIEQVVAEQGTTINNVVSNFSFENDGLHIGKKGSTSSVLLDNDSLDLKVKDTVVASLDQDKLTVNNVNINDRIQYKNKWKTYLSTTYNLNDIWIGGID